MRRKKKETIKKNTNENKNRNENKNKNKKKNGENCAKATYNANGSFKLHATSGLL